MLAVSPNSDLFRLGMPKSLEDDLVVTTPRSVVWFLNSFDNFSILPRIPVHNIPVQTKMCLSVRLMVVLYPLWLVTVCSMLVCLIQAPSRFLYSLSSL